MATLQPFNGLQVLAPPGSPEPPGPGGAAINDNFVNLAQRIGACNYTATRDPATTDNASNTPPYTAGSRWFNTTTNSEWVCIVSTTTSATWEKTTTLFSIGSALQATLTGNARGIGAVDLQLFGSGTSVASGTFSTILAGQNNAAGGADSIAAGYANNASGVVAIALGSQNTASGDLSLAIGYRNTASGIISTATGWNNTASNNYSIACGMQNTASANCATAVGSFSSASGYGSTAIGSGCSASDYGAAAFGISASASAKYSVGINASATKQGQLALGWTNASVTLLRTECMLVLATTDATQGELTLNGLSPSGTTEPGSNRFIVAYNKTYACQIAISARSSTGTSAMFLRSLVIKNVSGTVSLEGIVQAIATDINPSAWGGVTLQADSTNGSLQILVTGAASTSIRWNAVVRANEIVF